MPHRPVGATLNIWHGKHPDKRGIPDQLGSWLSGLFRARRRSAGDPADRRHQAALAARHRAGESAVGGLQALRKLVAPKLLAVGWDTDPHSIAEQRTITDGRIVPVGKGFVRNSPKRVDRGRTFSARHRFPV